MGMRVLVVEAKRWPALGLATFSLWRPNSKLSCMAESSKHVINYSLQQWLLWILALDEGALVVVWGYCRI